MLTVYFPTIKKARETAVNRPIINNKLSGTSPAIQKRTAIIKVMNELEAKASFDGYNELSENKDTANIAAIATHPKAPFVIVFTYEKIPGSVAVILLVLYIVFL
jgi:hypothetical protein